VCAGAPAHASSVRQARAGCARHTGKNAPGGVT
jgi:hypothetical protein